METTSYEQLGRGGITKMLEKMVEDNIKLYMYQLDAECAFNYLKYNKDIGLYIKYYINFNYYIGNYNYCDFDSFVKKWGLFKEEFINYMELIYS